MPLIAGQPLPAEGHEEEAKHVERREAGRDEGEDAQEEFTARGAECRANDLVFAPEAGRHDRETADGKGADQKRPEGYGQSSAEVSHVTDVLVVMERMDDIARRQEEQRLEEGVGHEVKHASRVGT